jgi:hypothetical protein
MQGAHDHPFARALDRPRGLAHRSDLEPQQREARQRPGGEEKTSPTFGLLRKWISSAPELQRETVYPYGAALAATMVPSATPVVVGLVRLVSSFMSSPRVGSRRVGAIAAARSAELSAPLTPALASGCLAENLGDPARRVRCWLAGIAYSKLVSWSLVIHDRERGDAGLPARELVDRTGPCLCVRLAPPHCWWPRHADTPAAARQPVVSAT